MTITSVLSARDKIGYGLGDMASALLGDGAVTAILQTQQPNRRSHCA